MVPAFLSSQPRREARVMGLSQQVPAKTEILSGTREGLLTPDLA